MANIRERTRKKVRTTPQGREFITENMKLYFDEDEDVIEFLEGKPVTWMIKEALRFYRDNHGKPQQPEKEAAATSLIGDL